MDTTSLKRMLEPYQLVVRYILADADRATKLIRMLGTQDGALLVVKTVMSVVETKQKIPPQIAPMLAIFIIAKLLKMAKEANGSEPPPKVLDQVMMKLLNDVSKIIPINGPQAAPGAMQQPSPTQPAPQPQQRPTGLIGASA